jgi:hypothetical protein
MKRFVLTLVLAATFAALASSALAGHHHRRNYGYGGPAWPYPRHMTYYYRYGQYDPMYPSYWYGPWATPFGHASYMPGGATSGQGY